MRTLLRGGRIHSPAARDAGALLVDGDTVAWVGDEDAADAAVRTGDADVVVDLDGALVTPAFVDAHVHLTATGLAADGLELSGVRSAAELLAAVAGFVATRPGTGAVLGSGWDESRWPDPTLPGPDELDRAAGGLPVHLTRVDAHGALVGAAVLAGSDRTLPGWSASGVLTRDAHHAARELALGRLGRDDLVHAQDVALRAAAAAGIGTVHEMGGPVISSAVDLAAALTPRGFAAPDVVGYWGELGAVETATALGAAGAAGDLFCDGSFGSHTAALHAPYADRPDTAGHLHLDLDAMVDHLLACTAAGLQAGFHAIGDAAVDRVLEAVRAAAALLPGVVAAGHRIEHAEAVTDPAALAASGLVASVQPAFDATWGGPAGMYADRLGPARAEGLNRFADLAAAGVPLAFGSDSPVTGFDPWGAVRAAVTPRHGGPGLSPRAAFAAHTRGGHRAGRRHGSGVLAPGTAADLAVWAAGPLAVDAPDDRVSRWSTDPRAAVPGLPDLGPDAALPRCLATWVRGAVAFDAGALGRLA